MASPSPDSGRWFVTGGSGFIGSRVVRLLANAGVEVVRASWYGDDGAGLPGREVVVDLRDAEAGARAMAGCGVVVHLAARSGGIGLQESAHLEVFRDNQAITSGVLAAAARAGAGRVFLASSGVVYTDELRVPIPEGARLVGPADRPNGYAWSKVCDEVLGGWYQKAGAFEVVVGRFTNIYGPGGAVDPARATVVHDLVRKALAAAPGGKLEVWGDGSSVRSFVYVEDAARAITTITRAGEAGLAYNVDGGEAVTIAGLAGRVRDLVDPDIEIVFDTARPTGAAYRVLDGTRLAGLGFAPGFTLADGLLRTVAAFREGPRGS